MSTRKGWAKTYRGRKNLGQRLVESNMGYFSQGLGAE